MQFRSRDLLHSPKLFKQKRQQKSEVLRLNCHTTTYNIKNYKFVLVNVFWLVPSPPLQVISSRDQTFPSDLAKQRNDLPKGLKIMQLVKKKKKLRTQEKVCPSTKIEPNRNGKWWRIKIPDISSYGGLPTW